MITSVRPRRGKGEGEKCTTGKLRFFHLRQILHGVLTELRGAWQIGKPRLKCNVLCRQLCIIPMSIQRLKTMDSSFHQEEWHWQHFQKQQ